MHEASEFSIWEYSAILFVVVLVSKLVSKRTGTVDVLWLIVAGAVLTNIAFVQNKIIDVTQFYTLMITAFLLNITVPLALRWWKPYYLGFKQIQLLGITLSRPEPAPIPADQPEYREMMEEERRRYLKDD